MKKIIIGIVAVVVVAAGAYVLLKPKNTSAPAASSQTTTPSTTKAAAATITYSNDGFTKTTTVKSGDTVAIKNTSSSSVQLDSDPHPVHTDDSDLNVGTVAPGETKTFVVTKTGTFGFHNHLDSNQTGTIVVQ